MDIFQNRAEAGRSLAKVLSVYKNKDAVVYSLPRGGVVVGAEIAKALSAPHDIVVARKIRHPANLEYAIGAVNDAGDLILNEMETRFINKKYLESEIKKERNEAKRRVSLYRSGRSAIKASGKVAIIVDDGIATGYTIKLALKTVKKMRPNKIIIAVPVSSLDIARELKNDGVEFLVLTPPEEFRRAVGAHYREFEQTSDEQVIDLLKA